MQLWIVNLWVKNMMKGDENTNRKLYINVHNYKDQNKSNSIKYFNEEGKEN